jgi:hypothetical protein
MNADGSRKRRLVENTFGCGCVGWIAHGREIVWNKVGTFATSITTGARHTLFGKPGSPAGISSSGTTIAVAGWWNGPITIVGSSGRRIVRVRVPRGWTHTQAAVHLAG